MLCGALLDSYVSRDEQHLARYGVAVVSAFPDFVEDLLGRLVLTITDGQGRSWCENVSLIGSGLIGYDSNHERC